MNLTFKKDPQVPFDYEIEALFHAYFDLGKIREIIFLEKKFEGLRKYMIGPRLEKKIDNFFYYQDLEKKRVEDAIAYHDRSVINIVLSRSYPYDVKFDILNHLGLVSTHEGFRTRVAIEQ